MTLMQQLLDAAEDNQTRRELQLQLNTVMDDREFTAIYNIAVTAGFIQPVEDRPGYHKVTSLGANLWYVEMIYAHKLEVTS